MGILLEADYKGVLTGKESVVGGLKRAFSPQKGGSQNPLERGDGEGLKSQERDGQLTYELMNRDSGEFGVPGTGIGRCEVLTMGYSHRSSSRILQKVGWLLRLYLCR